MKKLATILSIACLAFTVSGCNTFKGMGQDVERGGEKLQHKASDQQKKM